MYPGYIEINKKKYEYCIDVSEIIPPIAGIYKYKAIVPFVFLIGKDKNTKLDLTFGELHGKTTEEAYLKMEKIIKERLEKNN